MMDKAHLTHHFTVGVADIDFNNHMNVKSYFNAFDTALTLFTRSVGFDPESVAREGRSLVTAESHITYLRETKLGETLTIDTYVVGGDAKRLHIYQHMHRAGKAVAACEHMQLHFNRENGSVTPMHHELVTRFESLTEAQRRTMPKSARLGQAIGQRN